MSLYGYTNLFKRSLKPFEEVRLTELLILQKLLGTVTEELIVIRNTSTCDLQDIVTSTRAYEYLKSIYLNKLSDQRKVNYNFFESIFERSLTNVHELLKSKDVKCWSLNTKIESLVKSRIKGIEFILQMREILLTTLDSLTIQPRRTVLYVSSNNIDSEGSITRVLNQYFEDLKTYIRSFDSLVLSSTFFNEFRDRWELENPGKINSTILKDRVSNLWFRFCRQDDVKKVGKSTYRPTPKDLVREGKGYHTNSMINQWAKELSTLITKYKISTEKKRRATQFKDITTCVIDTLCDIDLSNRSSLNLTQISKREHPTKNMRYDLFRKIFGIGRDTRMTLSSIENKSIGNVSSKIVNGSKYKLDLKTVNDYISHLQRKNLKKDMIELRNKLFNGGNPLFYFEKNKQGFWLKRI